ncbi:formylglycine-generating enzyme family protein [Sinorhizobium meliloti]|uniref:formylglycine-generating enzyme family protein n=1 Tax=Rhizobium meliloti TaxID=382 RepID=UPI00237F8725|nr:formylglycine-generating enzyme family protein [Sinorhizobium meliloti]MDE3812584.1 formylglycine-generating enzyme family protein [Sinorhizobium meliloti]
MLRTLPMSLLIPFSAALAEPLAIGNRFAIDRTEVTIAEFQEFARAKGMKTAAERNGGGSEYGAGWERRPGWWYQRPFGEDPASTSEPAVHVSWSEAGDFCSERNGRLPTAEEWQLAAYTETRQKPTGSFETGRTYTYPTGDIPAGLNVNADDPWPHHAAAGATAMGVNGLQEIGGNAWEWLADRRGGEALTAGGSWWYGPDKTRREAMQWKATDFYAVYVGFRCVYDIGE